MLSPDQYLDMGSYLKIVLFKLKWNLFFFYIEIFPDSIIPDIIISFSEYTLYMKYSYVKDCFFPG